jgi:hypothetical protein
MNVDSTYAARVGLDVAMPSVTLRQGDSPAFTVYVLVIDILWRSGLLEKIAEPCQSLRPFKGAATPAGRRLNHRLDLPAVLELRCAMGRIRIVWVEHVITLARENCRRNTRRGRSRLGSASSAIPRRARYFDRCVLRRRPCIESAGEGRMWHANLDWSTRCCRQFTGADTPSQNVCDYKVLVLDNGMLKATASGAGLASPSLQSRAVRDVNVSSTRALTDALKKATPEVAATAHILAVGTSVFRASFGSVLGWRAQMM